MRASTIILISHGSNVWEFSNNDDVFIDGSCTLGEGKVASSVSLTLSDARLELANSLPLPLRSSRVAVEVWHGYGASLPKIFAGYVASYNVKGVPGTLEITAVDKAKGLRRVPKSRNFAAASGAQLVRDLIEEGGEMRADLSQADLSSVQFTNIMQMGESNFDTLARVLNNVGHEIYVRGDTAFVKKLATTGNGKTLIVSYGIDLITGFSFELDELKRSTTPNVFDRDGSPVAEAEGLESDVAEIVTRLANTGLSLVQVDAPGAVSQREQQALRAQAKAKRLFKASIELDRSHPELDVDWQVILRGMGPRFSGAWNVESATHNLKKGGTSAKIYNGGSNV